jgi:hypothetical protein
MGKNISHNYMILNNFLEKGGYTLVYVLNLFIFGSKLNQCFFPMLYCLLKVTCVKSLVA